ncbi:MAG: hypothetical protein AAF823_14750 [Planctomycetota bacterium]
MTPRTRILLVGHCAADTALLTGFARRHAPQATVVSARSDADLADATPDTLLLVNRVLERGFATDSGVDLIASLANKPDAPAAVLISNFPDAQQAALAAGARPGFGKAELTEPHAATALQAALNDPAPAPTD